MSIENDFLPFAVGSGSNVLSQSAYAALSAISQGYSSGIASSAAFNKTFRQSSIMAAVVAQFIVAQTGQPAIDDGTTATLLANFTSAVVAASKQRVILTDTGTANAYAAANAVPMTALPTTSGTVQTVQIAHTNTGASTYAPDGLAAKPIYGLGGVALQGAEMPVNGIATLVSYVGPLLNGGNLCWVLYECIGGAQQVAAATQSQHAMQLGQAVGRLLNVQVFTSSGIYTKTSGANTGIIKQCGGGGGGGSTAAAGSTVSSCAGSGGGGSYIEALVSLSGITTGTVTIGAGGTGAVSGAASIGGVGGSTIFSATGITLTTPGGSGGVSGPNATPPFITQGSTSSAQPSATGGTIIQSQLGDWSEVGYALNTSGGRTGHGGASKFGIGASGVVGGAGITATSATYGYGGGGSGALSLGGGASFAGGNGAPGCMIIFEYA